MDSWLPVIIFFGGFYLFFWTVSVIIKFVENRREKIRDQVAAEVLNGTDADKIIESYQGKLSEIKYKQDNGIDRIISRWKAKIPKHLRDMPHCPKCQQGYLRLREGRYGKFISCSLWPKCDYKTTVKNVKEEYKKKHQDDFMEDFRKAYN